MLAILATLVEGLHLQRPIRPRLPAAAAARLPAAAVAPLLAAAPFPASAAVSHHLAGPLSDVTLALASRGDGSQGLLASIARDPTDVYYLVLVLIGLFYLVTNVADRDDLEPRFCPRPDSRDSPCLEPAPLQPTVSQPSPEPCPSRWAQRWSRRPGTLTGAASSPTGREPTSRSASVQTGGIRLGLGLGPQTVAPTQTLAQALARKP